jgi:hypothetical protein
MQTLHSSLEAPASPLHSCFQTTDIDVAAYLQARSHELLRIDQVGESLIFTFPAEAALSAEGFYLGATVSAKLLLHAARRLEYLRKEKVNEHYFA